MMCSHNICNCINSKLRNPYKGGAGCLILTKKNEKWVALLGYEKFGTKNRNKLNLAAGGREDVDGGCYIKCALRELNQEFKISLTEEDFNKYFTDDNGNISYIVLGGITPVFIGTFPYIDIDYLNHKIKMDNMYSEDPCLKEMEFVDFVDIKTRKQIYNILPKAKISNFADTMLNKLFQSYNFM
jgi:hypothetical protein